MTRRSGIIDELSITRKKANKFMVRWSEVGYTGRIEYFERDFSTEKDLDKFMVKLNKKSNLHKIEYSLTGGW